MPQLRRSVTSMPTSPVPQFPRTLPASQPQLKQVVLQQAPLTMPPAYMQQMPLGPLQEGIAAAPAPAPAPAAPPQQQAYSRSFTPPPSQAPPVPVVSPAPVVLPQAAAPSVDPQEVHFTATSTPQQLHTPAIHVEQQGQPAALQESRYLQLRPQQLEAVIDTGQDTAANIVPGMNNPGSPATRQQTGLEPQVTQVSAASPAPQHSPPVFMRSFDVGTPQSAWPHASPRIMRTNTWSPSPNILQPALPGQAGAAHSVQGPLSMGFQQSWNHPIPALPKPEVAPLPTLPLAGQDYSHNRNAVPPSSPAQHTYAYPQSPPVQQTSLAYGRSMPLAGAAPGYAPTSRAYTSAASVPRPLSSTEAYAAAAPANLVMYQQPGPLSGGLAQQAGPAGSTQALRQQTSTSNRTVPASLAQGTVIQPMQGPVVVGEQSAAVTTEPMLMHSQGFSIQPLNPGQGGMQSTRGVSTAGMQVGSPGQLQQPDASRQGGGGIARRILQDFGRSSRSSFNAGASVSTSYQSDRSLQQVANGSSWATQCLTGSVSDHVNQAASDLLCYATSCKRECHQHWHVCSSRDAGVDVGCTSDGLETGIEHATQHGATVLPSRCCHRQTESLHPACSLVVPAQRLIELFLHTHNQSDSGLGTP